MVVILVVLGTFALCFAVDKGFTKLFRSKPQHSSGLAVRQNKLYGVAGIVLTCIGISALISGLLNSWLLILGGLLVLALGAGLITYYMTFGIYYDGDSFILTTFGRKSTVYSYRQILGQLLYAVQGGNVIVELHMDDGRAVQLQSNMDGAFKFLDHAYEAWLRQLEKDRESQTYHDTALFSWFPPVEVA